MSGEKMWETFQAIGSAIGILITFATFISLVSKKPLERIKKFIKEVHEKSNQKIEQDVKELLNKTNNTDKTTIVLLRHEITSIYEQYKSEKKFPVHVKEDLFGLVQQYDELGGNSYVHSIVHEMKEWETE